MIEAVSNLTKFNFDEIFHMPASDFLTYLRFINEKRRREYMQQKKEEAAMRARMNRKK
jgi:hypothetical protein